jgi:hypothetical protein
VVPDFVVGGGRRTVAARPGRAGRTGGGGRLDRPRFAGWESVRGLSNMLLGRLQIRCRTHSSERHSLVVDWGS